MIKEKKLNVFFAPVKLTPGYNFVHLLNDALSESRYFLLLLSPESLNANWPIAEQSVAIYSDPAGIMGRVIPIIVQPCRIPPLLQFRTYINFTKKDKKNTELKKLCSLLTNTPIYSETNIKQEINETKLVEITSLSHEPDYITETIYSNLLPVSELPSDIWSAPTSYKTKFEIRKNYNRNHILPAYILKNNRIYSFVDLSNENNKFTKVAKNYDISYVSTDEWIEDKDRTRWLIELLNDTIRSHTEEYRLSYDSTSDKYFYRKGVLRNTKISFKPHVKKAKRSFIIYIEREGRLLRARHRSVKLNFLLISENLYLKIDPGVIFTYEGKNVIADKLRQGILCTKFLSRQKNNTVFGEVRFWAWLLSEDGKQIKLNLGERFLEVNTKPISCEIKRGIYGDSKIIPEDLEAPPQLFVPDEPEEFEIVEEFNYSEEEI